jgi:isopenicillin-N epimerase
MRNKEDDPEGRGEEATRDEGAAGRRGDHGPLRREWTFDPGVVYLNHGSFGPSPDVVRRARERYSEELEREPMDFFVRRLEERLEAAAARLGTFVGASPDNLAFVPNATCAMNIVAASVELAAGDEVLLTDQEYGAVIRLWGRRCRAAGAGTVVAALPSPPTSPEEIVAAVAGGITDHTRLLVVSHVTSQTATAMPVEAICRAARERGVPVCIDGPHALAMRPLALDRLGCDFYCASGHKWLSAPFGSGFLYVAPRRKQTLVPAITSWGKSLSGRSSRWQDELHWFGTYDPAPYLAVPDAIAFLESVGMEQFRTATHALARRARQRLREVVGAEPLTPDAVEWYGSMVTLRLPQLAPSEAWPGKPHPLQTALWEQHRIEVPVFHWKQAVHLRVSCHLYNSPDEVELLCQAVRAWVSQQG